MFTKYHTRGIVISSKEDWGDSKIITVLTEVFGLISAKVQGARHTRSKLRSGAQDFSVSEFSLVHGKRGWKVVSAKSEKNIFELMRHSPEKIKVSANILNLIKKLSGEEVHPSLFSTVSNFLDFIAHASEENVSLAECLVLLKILHALGYMRHDPDFLIPISSAEIQIKDLEYIAPKRSAMIRLINESLRATHLT